MHNVNKVVPAVLLGSAVGDALGMPFEKRGCEIHEDLGNWDGTMLPGHSHLKLPAGNWTDDTEMAVALANSLIKERGFQVEKVADSYLEWYQHKPTGIGGTVRRAMEILSNYKTIDGKLSYKVSGQKTDDPESVGSGTVMRAAPLGVFYSQKPDAIRWACRHDAYITHADQEAYAASLAVASFIAGIIRHSDLSFGRQKDAAFGFVRGQMGSVVSNSITYKTLELCMESGAFDMPDPADLANTLAGRWGSAWQIAITSIHCAVIGWRSFEKGVLAAVRLGGDADTRGAVTGAILGALHGSREIPDVWTKNVVNINKGGEWMIPGKCASSLSSLDIELWQAAH